MEPPCGIKTRISAINRRPENARKTPTVGKISGFLLLMLWGGGGQDLGSYVRRPWFYGHKETGEKHGSWFQITEFRGSVAMCNSLYIFKRKDVDEWLRRIYSV